MKYTRQDRLTLESFIKVLDHNSPRNYVNVLGYSDGMLACTDGFFMLLYHSSTFQGEGTLDKLLQPTGVKYPAFKAVIPNKSDMAQVDGSAMVAMAGALKAKKVPGMLMFVDGDTVSISMKPVAGYTIDPFLLARVLKGLPKNTQLTSTFVGDQSVMLEFNDGVYQLILAQVRS